jgi:ferrous iron transport protein B
MAFTLLYTPCLSTVAVQIKESKSRMFALRSVLWSLALAWIAAFLVFQGGRLLGFGG